MENFTPPQLKRVLQSTLSEMDDDMWIRTMQGILSVQDTQKRQSLAKVVRDLISERKLDSFPMLAVKKQKRSLLSRLMKHPNQNKKFLDQFQSFHDDSQISMELPLQSTTRQQNVLPGSCMGNIRVLFRLLPRRKYFVLVNKSSNFHARIYKSGDDNVRIKIVQNGNLINSLTQSGQHQNAIDKFCELIRDLRRKEQLAVRLKSK